MQRMTVKQLEALAPTLKPYKRSVDTGLMVRVAPSGKKTFIVQYCVNGTQNEYPLRRPWGPATTDTHISLADARIDAERIRALAHEGVDFKQKLIDDRLAAEAQAALEAAAQLAHLAMLRTDNLTVKDMFDTWIADGVRRRDGNAELQRAFKADVLPAIGDVCVKVVSEHDIRQLLRTVVERGANRTAVMLRDNLTQMFGWAGKRQPWRKLLAEGDPMALIEIDKIVSPDYDLDNIRTRNLSIAEIRELRDIFAHMEQAYQAAPNKRRHVQPVEATTQAAVWIMLSTLCRVGELTMAKWEHVDLEAGVWTIPKANVKGKTASLKIYLSPFALAQFAALKKVTGHTDFCFPNRKGNGHMGLKAVSKQIGDRQCMFKAGVAAGVRKPLPHRHQSNALVLAEGSKGAWTPHDLRRTGATIMERLKIDKNVIDCCQNHVLGGSRVSRHYQQHDYDKEMRHAWKVLGKYLTQILAHAPNVIVADFGKVPQGAWKKIK